MYFKEVNKIFKYISNIKNSIIIAFLIIIIDYLNIPTQFIEKDMFLTIAVFCFLILLVVFDFLVSKKYSLITAKSINIMDKNIFIYIVSILIYSVYLIIDFKIYKIVILSVLLAISIGLIIWRIKYIKSLLVKQHKDNSNTYDLKEFFRSRY